MLKFKIAIRFEPIVFIALFFSCFTLHAQTTERVLSRTALVQNQFGQHELVELESPQARLSLAPFARVQNQHFDPNAQNNSIRIAQATARSRQHPFSTRSAFSNVKTVATNLRGFGVPFKISADNEAFIEVQLYLSRDMGQTWSFQGRQSTDKNEFPFQADSDGEYWFALKTLNRDRKLLPGGDPTPELKIVVDSVKPKLDFRVETDKAGRVVCRWRAEDKNLAPQSLQIFYQSLSNTTTAGEWQKVPVSLKGDARVGVYSDQLAWWPETTDRALRVAVEIADIAGNKIQLERQVVVPQSNWRSRSQSTAQVTDRKKPRSNFNSAGAWPTPQQIVPPNASQAGSGQQRVNPSVDRANPARQHTASHPPNVICKDGVCMPAPAQDDNQPIVAKRIPKKNPIPRVAVNQPYANNGLTTPPMQLVGSRAEFAAPPMPEGYVPSVEPRGQAPQRNQTSSQNSIVWKSETEKWIPKNQSSFSSTLRSDSSIAPNPYPKKPPAKPVTDVPSNAPTMSVQGDLVVGESSTMGPSNQYRGLKSQANQMIPSPELLPGIATQRQPQKQSVVPSEVALSRDQKQANTRTNRNLQPNSGSAWNTQAPRDLQSRNEQNPNPMKQSGFANRKMGAIGDAIPSRSVSTNNKSNARTTNNRAANTNAPTQIIGSKRFRLSYGIDAIDPSGVARVDLWVTRDQGKSWNVWGSDPDNQSPFPVEVQEEGRFGFRIVVHSKDGLTGQGPSSGDDADMWVLIDTQAPLTRITAVPYGRGDEAGRLVINYSVSDSRLTLRPITLSYSGNPEGPWTKIEEGIRNESRYVWKVKANVPDRIFLRIEAVDKAGNIGFHIPSQAIDVSGLVPRGTIHAVSPVGLKRN
ncbi:MAG: hypothetical protein AB8B55_14035 [Mariniblastus sp.]